jgi:hypothetical protein
MLGKKLEPRATMKGLGIGVRSVFDRA